MLRVYVQWWQVLTCLGMTRIELSRAMRPSLWAAFRGRLGLWLSFFWLSALAVFALYVAWQSSPSAWSLFWIFAGFATVLSCVALPAGSPGAMVVPVRYPRDILALRAAAASGDAALAPLSPLQLGVPDEARPLPARARIRPLYRPEAIFNSFNMGTAMVIATVVGAEQLLFEQIPFHDTIPVWSHVFPLLGGVAISLSVFFAARLFLLLRGFSVDTDEEGLAWRERGRLRRASWQDIHSLSVIELPEFGGLLRRPPRCVYVLDAGDASLIWTPSRGGRPRRRGANPSLLLCNLVVARTGLSLRDLTSEATAVVEARQQMSSRAAWREWLSSVVGDAPTALQRRLRTALLYVPFALAILLVLSLLLAGFAVVRLQPGAYADQLAAARASTPLLQDPLSENMGLWAVTPDGSQTFAGGAYVLNAQRGRREISAWTPDTFEDVLLEITMRYTTSFEFDQAGLILRADDASQTMLLFTITPSGEWQLRRLGLEGYASHNWRSIERTLIDEGNSYAPVGAIHQGLDATNHLAVVMRGSAYAFFINDQYVGAYRDDGGLTSGHVGMFVDNFGGTASYTDLAIYPAPPPTLLAPN